MYTDENSDKECEFDEISPEDSPNVTKKSLSTVGFRNTMESQARPMALRATQSFTGAVEELRLGSNFQRVNLSNRGNVTPISKSTPVCPCGCLLRPAVRGSFRTREINTLALLVVAPEVLNHHGYNFEPNQIAMFWKKDCRKFLWKGKSKTY
ncbi:uncharacterized protein LOC123707573 [Pieris brassicae]|uniref:Uncharacterized protein n=1 Tax=Pieris brassicae TaxID=7116 RepID=A0A9P0T847_PIEBR|nr:uncharacterized protein LOC123707573 [Pieris brassicae]CAH4013398.1 unnamed protein product [Pieris brassicae]